MGQYTDVPNLLVKSKGGQQMKKIILLAIVLVLMPFTVSASLVAHYELDGNSNDETGNYNGTTTDVSWTVDRFGNPNGAAQFNGTSSYIDTIPSGDIPSTITFAAWILPTHLSRQLWGSVYNADGGKNGYHSGFGLENLNFYYYKNNTRMDIGNNSSSEGSVPLDEWSHVAFTLDDANKTKIYVNGNSIFSGELSGSADSHDRALMIGRAIWTQTYINYEGSIDDVRIYDIALSESEIQQLAIVPEPISSILFLTGGALLAGRRFTKRKKIA